MTRIDNDANVIAISGAMSSFKALDIVDAFLKTPFLTENVTSEESRK